MKLGIISRSNLDDKKFWSGVPSTVFSNLKKNKIKVVKIDKLNENIRKILTLKREYLKIFKKLKFDETYNLKVAKNYANQIEKRLKKNLNLNYLLTFDLSLISHLESDIPIIVWTDILYSDYYSHYFNKQKISKSSLKDIKLIEYNAIKKCKIILFSSRWSLNKARRKYKKFKKKFKLLEFGPSFDQQITKNKIEKNIDKRVENKIKLITLSVDWKRKGLQKQIELVNYIISKGFDGELTIVGQKNKNNIKNLNVKFLGFINKNSKSGERKISNLLLKSHFHLLFSKAEAYGLALIEANSRGVPNISFNVGGIPHIIKNGKNGKLFKENEKIQKIGNYIINLFQNKKLYKKISMSSYFQYKKKFDYEKIIFKLKNIIKE